MEAPKTQRFQNILFLLDFRKTSQYGRNPETYIFLYFCYFNFRKTSQYGSIRNQFFNSHFLSLISEKLVSMEVCAHFCLQRLIFRAVVDFRKTSQYGSGDFSGYFWISEENNFRKTSQYGSLTRQKMYQFPLLNHFRKTSQYGSSF